MPVVNCSVLQSPAASAASKPFAGDAKSKFLLRATAAVRMFASLEPEPATGSFQLCFQF
jgi:hypothetical protein